MKVSGQKKIVKKAAKKKSKVEEWFINILTIVLLGGGLVVVIYMTTQMGSTDEKARDKYLASLPPQRDTIAHNQICMVDDIYQGDYPTLPLILADRIYYGCSAKATKELATKRDLRTAVDPVTNRRIDKATAVIALHPKRDGKVLYFESQGTFNQYLNTDHHR